MPADLQDPVRRPRASRPTPRAVAPAHRSHLPSHRAVPRAHRAPLVRLWLALVLGALLAGGIGVAVEPPTLEIPAPDAPSAAPSAPAPAGSVRATVVDIPALRVHSDLVPLGVDAAGALVPPASPAVAGWFTGSSPPGEPGPTVIAGHVDSRTGPGVFFRLEDLAPGDEVTVGRSDGSVVRYRVTGVSVVAKRAFPTDAVYGPTPAPELRLITCGGEFDHSIGHYLRNVVVSAVLVG